MPSLPSGPSRSSRGNWGGKLTRSSAPARAGALAGVPEVLLSAEAVALVEAPAGSSAGGRPGTRVAFTRDTTCSPSALCEGPGVVAPMGSVGRWSGALTGCVDRSPACDCLSVGAIVALAWKLISFDGLRPVATRSRGQRRRPRRRRRVSSTSGSRVLQTSAARERGKF